MNSQKLILLIFLVNMTLGLVSVINADVATYDSTAVLNEINNIEGEKNTFESEETLSSGLANTAYQEQQTLGNTVRWGRILFRSFLKGFWFTLPENFTEQGKVYEILTNALHILSSYMYLLIIMEVYMIIKNRKTN